jgi:Protein of unknown function (DUF433)
LIYSLPIFKGTRIMVWQVLEDVADGRSWDLIKIMFVGEAVRLAQRALLDERGDLVGAATRADRSAALA